MVAVEWVVLVNCTEVGCDGLLGPKQQHIKIQDAHLAIEETLSEPGYTV